MNVVTRERYLLFNLYEKSEAKSLGILARGKGVKVQFKY